MKTACIYAHDGQYGEIIDTLRLFIGNFKVETDVEPFMLSYRSFDLYVIKMSQDMPNSLAHKVVSPLLGAMRNYGTRVFAAWTDDTLDCLRGISPSCIAQSNFVNCDSRDWTAQLTMALRARERKERG